MAVADEVTADDKNYAMGLHLSGLGVLLIGFGFLGPLIMWLIRKDESEFVNAQGKAAVNFHLSILLWQVVCLVLILTIVGAIIGLPGVLILGIMQIIFSIIVGIKAANGEDANYPLSIRFLT